jgi:hypothetical protein
MQRWFPNRKYLLLGTMIALPVLLLGVCLAALTLRRQQHVADAYVLARQLDYTPATEIAHYRRCWDPTFFGFAHCGVFVHYTTDLPFEAFEQQVNRLKLRQKRFGPTSGYGIFNDINLSTDRLLTADNNDGLLNRFDLPEPEAYEWLLVDKNSREHYIYFHDTTSNEHIYELDGSPLQGNIVTIMLQTR